MNTSPAPSQARTHPCLRGDPPPSSAQQPDLTVAVHYFHLDRAPPANYSYDITPSPGKKAHIVYHEVPFYYFSGRGPPPTDLTGDTTGAIYVDLTEEEHAAYGRVADGSWKRWFDPQPSKRMEDVLVKHPHFPTRRLWCSYANGVSWFTKTTIVSNQERAKARKAVSGEVDKTQEVRWREASTLIRASLGGEQADRVAAASRATQAADTSRNRRFTSTLSPVESREPTPAPAPVLRKRKRQQQDSEPKTSLEAQRCKAGLESAVQRLKAENSVLETTVSALETELARCSAEDTSAESQCFAQWVETVIGDGFKIHELGIKNELGVSCSDYLDLDAHLTSVTAQLALQESQCADAQTALERAVLQDNECIKQFGLATSHLGRTFGWDQL